MSVEKYQILKNLALEFESNRDPAIFKKIIAKVEKLLLQTIYRLRRAKPYLKKVELQDLYQTSIIGLHRALLKVKKDEPSTKLVYKIIRYVGNEITKSNKTTNRIVFPRSIEYMNFQIHLRSADRARDLIDQIEAKLTDNVAVYKNLEMEDIRDRFSILLEEGVVSLEEFEMITMRFVNGMTYVDIAKQFGGTYETVSRRIKNILNTLRCEFNKRNWEGI